MLPNPIDFNELYQRTKSGYKKVRKPLLEKIIISPLAYAEWYQNKIDDYKKSLEEFEYRLANGMLTE